MKTLGRRWMTACAVLLCCGPVALLLAAESLSGNMIGLKTENGKIAYDFIDLWLNHGKGGEAFGKYVSRDYMNHYSSAPPGAQPDGKVTLEQEREMAASMKMPPGAHMEFKQLVAQGDLVFAHLHSFINSEDKLGNELVIILRIRDGKVVDHWDLHVDLKANSTVFQGLDRFEGK